MIVRRLSIWDAPVTVKTDFPPGSQLVVVLAGTAMEAMEPDGSVTGPGGTITFPPPLAFTAA